MTLRLAEDTLFADRFGTGAPFRVGVEEELFLVDHHAHAVDPCTDELLGALRRPLAAGRVLGELCDGVVELATRPCASAEEAAAALRALRAAVLGTGLTQLLGAGLHPATPFGKVHHRDGGRYEAVGHDTRGTLRQAVFCGVHVHVGMPDAETAIAAFNGMRKWLPLLQALAANSPFWHGQDSGLASARTVRIHDVPRSGSLRAFRDWADYRDTMRELVRLADIEGLGSLWWDMRPHPKLGTLEIRVLDAQSSLDDLRGLIALIHSLAYHEAMVADQTHPPKELLDEASFRAIRDGMDARLSLGGPVQHVQALARQALDLAYGYAPALGCTAALEAIEVLLAEGNGADRQRRAHARGGMEAVLAGLTAETSAAGPPFEPAMAAHSTAHAS
jgi:glutamate---cysteine ligase / carboxylate-amine ligase